MICQFVTLSITGARRQIDAGIMFCLLACDWEKNNHLETPRESSVEFDKRTRGFRLQVSKIKHIWNSSLETEHRPKRNDFFKFATPFLVNVNVFCYQIIFYCIIKLTIFSIVCYLQWRLGPIKSCSGRKTWSYFLKVNLNP